MTFEHPIEIGDPAGQSFEQVEALVGAGATLTVVPPGLLERLGVERVERRTFRLADGRAIERDIGETMARVDGVTVRAAVIFGEEDEPVLLGAYTLERAFLAVDPHNERLIPTEGLLM
ncbi:MAG: retroviral-like aspartic protease family protein [Chloroflexota bacterium]